MDEVRGSVDRGLYTPQGEKQNVGDSTSLMALRKAKGATKMPKIAEACVHGDVTGLAELLRDLSIDGMDIVCGWVEHYWGLDHVLHLVANQTCL